MHQLSSYPARRSVKDMSALFGATGAGEPLAVSFESERYGRFRVEGFAALSITEDLLVGGIPVAKELKRDKTGAPTRQPEAEVRLATSEVTFDTATEPANTTDAQADGTQADASTTVVGAHGDIVRASFTHPTYGHFSIVGALTLTEAGTQPAVGPWLVGPSAGGHFLTAMETLATQAESPIPTPSRRGAVIEDLAL